MGGEAARTVPGPAKSAGTPAGKQADVAVPAMPFVILALFVGIPLLELAVLIRVGGLIGFWPTIGILVFMAFLGTWLLRHQSLSAIRKTETDLREGRIPVESALDGMGLFLAGILLVIPGFLSDCLALLLLIPPVRHLLARQLILWLTSQAEVDVRVLRRTSQRRERRPLDGKGPVIEGDFRHVDEEDGPGGDKQGP